MTVIRGGAEAPIFRFNNADLIGESLDHFVGSSSFLGASAYNIDEDAWYVIKADGTLSLQSPLISGSMTVSSGNITLSTGTNSIGSVKNSGLSQTLTRTVTTSADMTTAAAITPSPSSGQKVVLTDALISSDTEMVFTLQMETSNNVLAKLYLGANQTVSFSLQGYLKGDAINKKIFGLASATGNVSITAITFSEA